jgi:hypothetical protein
LQFNYYEYGYGGDRTDIGAIIVVGIFIAAIAVTIFIEYLLYGVLTSLFDAYLASLQPLGRFILTIVILVVLFPLLFYGFLIAAGLITIAAILIFIGSNAAKEMMTELMRRIGLKRL